MAGRRRRRRRIYFVFNDTIEGSPGRWAVGPLRSRPRVRERLRIREREFVGDLAQTGSMASSSVNVWRRNTQCVEEEYIPPRGPWRHPLTGSELKKKKRIPRWVFRSFPCSCCCASCCASCESCCASSCARCLPQDRHWFIHCGQMFSCILRCLVRESSCNFDHFVVQLI